MQQSGCDLVSIEIKSSSTYNANFKKGLDRFNENTATLTRRYLIYNGEDREFSDGFEAVPFARTSELF